MNKQTTSPAFDLSEYIVLLPKCSERTKKAIYIMRNGEIRLNSHFMKELDLNTYHYATIFLHKSKKEIVLLPETEPSNTAVFIKKNGYASLANVVEQFKNRGIKLPACFEVSEKTEGNQWFFTYNENYHFPEVKASKKKLSKPRKDIPVEVFL